jgi:hypothetical protein
MATLKNIVMSSERLLHRGQRLRWPTKQTFSAEDRRRQERANRFGTIRRAALGLKLVNVGSALGPRYRLVARIAALRHPQPDRTNQKSVRNSSQERNRVHGKMTDGVLGITARIRSPGWVSRCDEATRGGDAVNRYVGVLAEQLIQVPETADTLH